MCEVKMLEMKICLIKKYKDKNVEKEMDGKEHILWGEKPQED